MPKHQLIIGVKWECVIVDSVQLVCKKKKISDDIVDMFLNESFGGMHLKGKD